MPVGINVGGYEQRTDWPKLGPSLLIATCVILAIWTTKWPAVFDKSTSHPELDKEIDFAANLAGRVLSALASKREGMFNTAVVNQQRRHNKKFPSWQTAPAR